MLNATRLPQIINNILLYLFFTLVLTSCAGGQLGRSTHQEYRQGMVVSASRYASEAGLQILKKGGNAVDAAVAVQFALAVVYPNAGNLGGGGFMVYRSAAGETAALDFREKAAAAATRDMYLDSLQNPVVEKSLFGHLAAGVPGSVAGMEAAHKRYGKLSWKTLLAPAIALAAGGYKLSARGAEELNGQAAGFRQYNLLGTALVKAAGTWKEGDLLVQQELAATLAHIAERGAAGFYDGPVARLIVEEMQRGGGIMTAADLRAYRAVWRTPVTGIYRGLKIITMPPPSSGGIALMQLLQMVEPYPLRRWGFNKDSTIQLMVEAERRVYADRAAHLGDPDFHPVPQHQLLNENYNTQRMAGFTWERSGNSAQIAAGLAAAPEHEETTHFSVVDRNGNAVSITTTLNGSYGSNVVVKGAGFLLNNEMDDFSVKPGSPNMYGLVGGKANAIAPGKRMLSSMTPTVVEKDGKLFMVVGTPGGSTIITSVFQTIVNVVDFDMGMQAAVNARKFHHQWLPDEVYLEKEAIDSLTHRKLTNKGYRLVERGNIGRVDAILRNKWGYYEAGADPRGDDSAAAW
ncbi:gamma-glutamyltransferase [Pedobacter sp. SYP-B3415]|uniref:gamma-glutamyltransferase n=1 Tax=Pedobacter sp. SYP-B3415 TaxID=2496641 RepID=UPI001980AA4A|nr:gamma-glutamyltransferase [Pedobacter sp. SYP-B3415]